MFGFWWGMDRLHFVEEFCSSSLVFTHFCQELNKGKMGAIMLSNEL
jgi:hypothetical protein